VTSSAIRGFGIANEETFIRIITAVQSGLHLFSFVLQGIELTSVPCIVSALHSFSY